MTLLRLGLAACLLVWPAAVPSAAAQAVLETFESPLASWPVQRDVAESGAVDAIRPRAPPAALASARLTTGSSGCTGGDRHAAHFADAASARAWEERPGTCRWQRARLFVPAATVAGPRQRRLRHHRAVLGQRRRRLRMGGPCPADGALSVVGHRHDDGVAIEFPVYATLPVDRWIELEIGLHSQLGPGVKRGFAFVLDGQFYGWYHQGRMESRPTTAAAIGLVETNVAASLEAFVDDWGDAGTTAFPTGTDLPVDRRRCRNRTTAR